MKKNSVHVSTLLMLTVFLHLVSPLFAALPDATKDYIDATYTYNLGPTGARGWIYSTGNEWLFVPEGLTRESRQIKITLVEKGSPADGVLQLDDVILGIGASVFTKDARKALGIAIGEAEKAANKGKLTVPLNEMCAWPWGYNNTFLSEYYLVTGDKEVLHAISEYTITSARGQSWCGTYGHGMAWPKPDGSTTHGIVPPYGALNQAGLLVSIGIVLGEKCLQLPSSIYRRPNKAGERESQNEE